MTSRLARPQFKGLPPHDPLYGFDERMRFCLERAARGGLQIELPGGWFVSYRDPNGPRASRATIDALVRAHALEWFLHGEAASITKRGLLLAALSAKRRAARAKFTRRFA